MVNTSPAWFSPALRTGTTLPWESAAIARLALAAALLSGMDGQMQSAVQPSHE
jgi:hypothetical protein